MTNESDFSRRKFLGAAAGVAGLAAVGSAVPSAFAAGASTSAADKAVGERLVPPGKLGIQQFSIRDAITRLSIAKSKATGVTPTQGYLGGPNFPADPTDLGPLVDLPGGFEETFAYLAGLGYRGFEFFQFSQNVNELGRQPTPAEIRTYLDNAGLASFGTHTGGLGNALTGAGNGLYNPTTGGLSAIGQTQLDLAATLGHTMIGTAGDPTGLATLANSATQAGWTEMAHRANVIGQVLADNGIRWYWHTEQNGWQFFTDAGLTRTHRIDWWAANTDPSLVNFEPDILHSYAGRARFPDPVNGSLWDALGFWTANSHRLVGWHVKDGNRLVPAPAAGVNPFTQTVSRPPTFVPGSAAGPDVVYSGEGSIGQGFPVDPDPAVVGYRRIFDEVGEKGSRFFIVESDSGIGNAADRGRSLRHAKVSLANMLGLRGGFQGNGSSDAPDGAEFESVSQAG